MLKVIKELLERSAYLIALTITFIIVYLSLSSLEELDVKITVSDKILHSLAYFVLSICWFFAIKKSHFNVKIKLVIASSVLLFGIILEILQETLAENRMMDYKDVFANSLGIILAFLTFDLLLKGFRTI